GAIDTPRSIGRSTGWRTRGRRRGEQPERLREESTPGASVDDPIRPQQQRAWDRQPRAFAVLRLITNSKLVGCSMGRSAGLAPCEHLVLVRGATAELIDDARPIGDKTTVLHTHRTHRLPAARSWRRTR